MIKLFAIAAPLLLALSACSSNVHVDYETQHNFSGYQQFKLQEHAINDQETYEAFGGDIFEARLHRAISDHLSSKGLDASDSPDFLIDYSLTKELRSHVSYDRHYYHQYYWGFGTRHYYGLHGRPHLRDISQYTLGTLTLKIIDAASNKTVWTSSTKTILRPGKTPADAETAIRERIATMLANFPPNNVITL